MKYLLQGAESQERVELLLSLTRINGEGIRPALIDHLVKGMAEKHAATAHSLERSNFDRALARLNEVAGTVEKIKDLDWAKFKSDK